MIVYYDAIIYDICLFLFRFIGTIEYEKESGKFKLCKLEYLVEKYPFFTLFLILKYFTWKYSSCEANVCIFGYTPKWKKLSNLIHIKDFRIRILFNNIDILIDFWYIDHVQQLMDH